MDYFISRPAVFAPTRGAAADRGTVGGLTLILASCIFLQRLAIPLSGEMQISLAFIAAYVIFAFLLLLGRLTISAPLFMAFLVTMSSLTVSVLVSAEGAKLTSYAILFSIYLLYIFKVKRPETMMPAVWTAFLKLMAVCAAAGIFQFFSQFVLPIELVFPLDYFMPEKLLATGYNVIIPLKWEVEIYRATGYVFLEPSFFSQFLGLALIIEMLGARRIWLLGLFAAALVVSYSGTGIAIALIFLPWLLLRRGNIGLLTACVLGAVVLMASSTALNLDMLTSRVGEFSAPNSSGFARFISPFLLVRDFLLDSTTSMLFGLGPGAIDQVLISSAQHSYLAHDPTWVKALFEYGFIASVCLLFYTAIALFHGARHLTLGVAIMFVYLFLGGYLLNGFLHFTFVVLAAWHADSHVRVAAQRPQMAFVWR